MERRFGVNKRCWSTAFDGGPQVPQRRATKTGISTKEGGAAARPLGLSRERWRVVWRQSWSQCTERWASQAVAATANSAEDQSRLSIKTRSLPLSWIQQLFLLEIRRAHIHFVPFTVSMFSVAHKRSHRDDGSSLLPTALWEVQSVSS